MDVDLLDGQRYEQRDQNKQYRSIAKSSGARGRGFSLQLLNRSGSRHPEQDRA